MKCTRCNGIGYIEKYAHIMNGRCFHCLGSGTEPIEMEINASQNNCDSEISKAYDEMVLYKDKIKELTITRNAYRSILRTLRLPSGKMASKEKVEIKLQQLDDEMKLLEDKRKAAAEKRYNLIQLKKEKYKSQ